MRSTIPKKYIETHKYGKVTPAEFDESTYPESVRDDDVVILEHTDDIILSVIRYIETPSAGQINW
ncbi:MAG: hypothetical protein L6V80_02945 [Bacteroidales bacterium]|nr:MAG: hypothetical protein L6V80_02945 [Bacteroidales bacterium]